jgi:hypothetical protein
LLGCQKLGQEDHSSLPQEGQWEALHEMTAVQKAWHGKRQQEFTQNSLEQKWINYPNVL